jgi:hypothetical protein
MFSQVYKLVKTNKKANGEIVAVREENAKIALDGRVVDFAYVDEEIMWIILRTFNTFYLHSRHRTDAQD